MALFSWREGTCLQTILVTKDYGISYTQDEACALAMPPDSWAALGKLINLSGLPCSKNSGNGSQRMRVVGRLSGICEQLAKLLTVHALGTRMMSVVVDSPDE